MNGSSADTSPHLLVVDDDGEIRGLLERFLTKHGFRVTSARDGREMKRALEDWQIDLIILDLMLPGDDGLTLCRDLRATSQLPVIMLTNMGEETDRIIGLEMGADDYLAKPFNPRELIARIKAVLRRTSCAPARVSPGNINRLSFANWTLDLGLRHLISPADLFVDLSAGEFELLVAFVQHPRRVLTRNQLLDLTRGRSEMPFDRSIDMQVSRLRQKIETDPKTPKIIKTVRGGGYVFTEVVTEHEPAVS